MVITNTNILNSTGRLSDHNFTNLIILYLFGGLNPSEKYEFVGWDDEIPNETNKNIMFTIINHY